MHPYLGEVCPQGLGISSSDDVAGRFWKRFDPQCLDTPYAMLEQTPMAA